MRVEELKHCRGGPADAALGQPGSVWASSAWPPIIWPITKEEAETPKMNKRLHSLLPFTTSESSYVVFLAWIDLLISITGFKWISSLLILIERVNLFFFSFSPHRLENQSLNAKEHRSHRWYTCTDGPVPWVTKDLYQTYPVYVFSSPSRWIWQKCGDTVSHYRRMKIDCASTLFFTVKPFDAVRYFVVHSGSIFFFIITISYSAFSTRF